MVLPGYSLMAQGTQIHVAAWPGREPLSAPQAPIAVWPRQLLLSRAFASQAACYVVLAGGIRLREHVPERYRHLHCFDHTGDSYIIDPRGEIIAGPANGEEILIADGSMETVSAAKIACDVGGHYSRPDIFQLAINCTLPQRIVELMSLMPVGYRAVKSQTRWPTHRDLVSAENNETISDQIMQLSTLSRQE